ncbi:MAG TPA: FAD-dependent oxidoreductase [Candidatus Limnocylindria bacterium]|nr:FAD-dependent oxidoreductase [Candidatus Limnocylindria bacterium]
MAELTSASTLVIGAGIAGVAIAHALATRGHDGVVIVDERAPLSLTSAVSTECYRDWWPGPDGAMTGLMTRSIDILEDLADESSNVFNMNRRGYLFATADERRIAEWERGAEQIAAHGGGPLRKHENGSGAYVPSPPRGVDRGLHGADLITDRALIARRFPYLSPETVAVLHARRCGWLSAHGLGTYLLEEARARGAALVRARVGEIETASGRIAAVRVDDRRVPVERVVVAAGPHTRDIAALAGLDLPIELEPHQKVAFHDTLGAIPRDAPFLIWSDPQRIPWSDEERAELARSGAEELARRRCCRRARTAGPRAKATPS